MNFLKVFTSQFEISVLRGDMTAELRIQAMVWKAKLSGFLVKLKTSLSLDLEFSEATVEPGIFGIILNEGCLAVEEVRFL